MENWTSQETEESPSTFYRHDNQWSAGKREDYDWMESEKGAELKKPEKAWPLTDEEAEEGFREEGAELGAVSEDDLYVQLTQKEQDLMLAAELGKALLEKNQDLEQQVAKLTEELNQKTEVFEQERHCLQCQLTQRQGEYENTVRDLQDDIRNLKEQLRHHDDETSADQRRHISDLRQLQQHNESLSEQLRQTLVQHQALSAEAGHLRDQLTSRRSNFHQRVTQVDELEKEVECLRLRQQDLEAQIRQVKAERDALAAELENFHERVLVLEKQRQFQEEQLHHQNTEIQEMRDINSMLQTQLQQMTSRGHVSGDSPTLFSELSHLNDPSISPPPSLIQFHNGKQMGCLVADMLEDDFEYDDDIFCDVIRHSSPVPVEIDNCGNQSHNNLQDESQYGGDRRAAGCRQDFSQSSATAGGAQDSEGDVANDANNREGNPAARAEADLDVTEMTYQSSQMTYQPSQLHLEREETDEEDDEEDSIGSFDRLSRRHFNDMLQAQQNRVEKLEYRVQELEFRVQELQQERDRLQDAAVGDVNVGHVLQQTRRERDRAISRACEVERELSQLTADVVSLNAQLLATIRRKVMISQELDQWQMDLSEVLSVPIRRRTHEQQEAGQTGGQHLVGTTSEEADFKKHNR